MKMNTNSCSICLENKYCTVRFSDLDENNINWLTKLKSIEPNLQEEYEQNYLCTKCAKQIDDIITFKERLQNLVERLKLVNKKEEEDVEDTYPPNLLAFNEDNDDSKDLDYGDYKIDLLNPSEYSELKKESFEGINVKEEYTCDGCNDEFKSKTELKSHRKTCSKCTKPTFTCYTCNKTYTSKTNLKLHHKKCGKVSKTEENQDEVLEKKSKRRGRKSDRSYSCETCNKIFNLVKDLMAHSKDIHGMEEKCVKPYLCNQCPLRFRTYAGYDQHLKYHSRNRDNVCSLCGKRFITKSELIVHEYTHFNRRNYKCTTCNKAFNTNKNLKTHILVVHTDRSAWKYACAICEKRFPQKGNYDQHMKRHAGDKQHICHICQKPFITSSELKRHVSLHSNVKAFTCEYCQREYKTFRTLKTHLRRSHSIGEKLPEKEKKYVCHICPSQFYDKQKLSRHLYCHSGVKPFSCTACDKKFADKSYLKHHMKVAHNLMYLVDEHKYEPISDLKYELPIQLKFEFDGVK